MTITRGLVVVWAVAAFCLYGCAGAYEAKPEITGNNTGGVIPAKMAASGNSESLAAAHCAKYGATARVTFSAAQTGGEAVFICEKGGQPAMNPTPAPAGPSVIPAPRK